MSKNEESNQFFNDEKLDKDKLFVEVPAEQRNNHLIKREFLLDMTPWEKFISEVEPLEICPEEQSLGGY